MTAFIRLLAAVCLVLPAVISPTPIAEATRVGLRSFLPAAPPITNVLDVAHAAPAPRTPETNAERMKRGLPPKKPVRRSDRALYARHSSSPSPRPPPPPPSSELPSATGTVAPSEIPSTTASTSDTPSSTPPPTPTSATSPSPASTSDSSAPPSNPTYPAYIQASYNGKNGYVSATINEEGLFAFTTEKREALGVEWNPYNNTPTVIVGDLNALNGNRKYPFAGFVSGSGSPSTDIHTSSFDYFFLGGSTQTPPLSPPLFQDNTYSDAINTPEGVESAVWSVENNGVVDIIWANKNGARIRGLIIYVPASEGFAITGNVEAFKANVGDAYTATFTYVRD